MLEFKKVVRDPIHGYIGLTEEELNLIELPIFQRLRWINQLSLVDLVYPDAKHTRFSHSLGVMHLCWKYGEHLRELGLIKDEDDINLLRLTGLLHDIGHGPFSHAFEPAFYEFILNDGKGQKDVHVRFGQEIICNKDYEISDVIGMERAKIVSLLVNAETEKAGKPLVFRDIIKGLFCADRLDYLQRDAYHMGTPEYAIIDSERIIRSLFYHDSSPIYLKKGLYALEGAILSYNYLYRAAYYHHTTRAAYSLFMELAWTTLEARKEEIKSYYTPEKFKYFTDMKFIEIAYENSLTRTLLTRRLPKTVLAESDFKRYSDLFEKLVTVIQRDFKLKREIERKVKNSIGVNLVLIDTPIFTPYVTPEAPEPHILTDKTKPIETQGLSDLSLLLRSLKSEQNKPVPRVYIDRESLPREKEKYEGFKKKLVDTIWENLNEK